MLGNLLSRTQLRRLPDNHHEFDVIFREGTFPFGISAEFLLACTYGQYRGSDRDSVPVAYKYYSKFVEDILKDAKADKFEGLSDRHWWLLRSAHACCYERSQAFTHVLQNTRDPWFAKRLVDTRLQLLPERAAEWGERERRRVHYRRRSECMEASLDITGATDADLLQQMTPDDWHQIVMNWNWDNGVSVLSWITSQPTCDRGTAAIAFFRGDPCHYAASSEPPQRHSDPAWDYGGFIYALAGRLESGFYAKSELAPFQKERGIRQEYYQNSLEVLRATGRSPWLLPEDLISRPAVRVHTPKYDVNEGRFYFHYEYWLKHIAPPPP